MPTVTLALTIEQVVELVEQLPPDQQSLVYQRLAKKQWGRWVEASQGVEAQARGLNWDALGDDERMLFVNDLVHDGRGRYRTL